MNKFTVDTQLFRELGELLVGRDSTALIELVKNAYDADARSAIVYGEAIEDLERGFIQVTDDGIGMTADEFENGFLRIASRTRSVDNRTSYKYQRRFTGEKGIGRLAAHKLASLVEVETVPTRRTAAQRQAVSARIDWDQVEEAETLDGVLPSAIRVDTHPVPSRAKSGTTVTLRRLRRQWTKAELGQFLIEVQDFEPPDALVGPLPPGVVPGRHLFKAPRIRASLPKDPGFRVRLEGEFEGGENYWTALVEAAHWLIEIDASRDGSSVRYRISPTSRTLSDLPGAEPTNFELEHPNPGEGPFFQSKIFVREGALKRGPQPFVQWARRATGIRVFLEGFRVLPYGDVGNDWLSLDSDYARRERGLPGLAIPNLPSSDKDAALVFLPNRAYFGAAFVVAGDAPTLRTLVNREGFVPERPYNDLVTLVRTGIDLSVRVRAAVGFERREARRRKRRTRGSRDSTEQSPSQTLHTALDSAVSHLTDAKQLISKGDPGRAQKRLSAAQSELVKVAEVMEEFMTEEAMLRVLASVGTEMAAFIHEINALLGSAESLQVYAAELRQKPKLPRKMKSELANLQTLAEDLRRGLERQSAYLVDIVTPDARRRRVRQRLADRFDAGSRLIGPSAQRRGVKIVNEIPKGLRSRPMFPAELTAIFSNLLTNAVKAAGEGGRVRAWGERRGDQTRVVVENTGAKVDPKRGERWFKPFESTTTQVDAVLGQGMGLGLPITRRILEEYGADIRFTAPSNGYSTAVEIVMPE